MRLLSNWEFWSALVAALALFLSQIPPLYQLWNRFFSRAILTTEVYRYVLLGHLVGNPQLKFSIVISNTGGKEVKITNITITLSRDGKELITLPAQMYSPEAEPSKQLLFAGFKIKPGEDRSYVFHFYADWQRDQASEWSEKVTALMNDIVAKKEARFPLGGQAPLIEGEPKNITPFHEMLQRNFMWSKGEYVMDMLIKSSDMEVFVNRKYRFTLFESDSKKLLDYEKRYKYGEGIFYGTENQWSWIKISEA